MKIGRELTEIKVNNESETKNKYKYVKDENFLKKN